MSKLRNSFNVAALACGIGVFGFGFAAGGARMVERLETGHQSERARIVSAATAGAQGILIGAVGAGITMAGINGFYRRKMQLLNQQPAC